MKILHRFDNIIIRGEDDSADVVCCACGQATASYSGIKLPDIIRVGFFILAHHKCKGKKKLKIGTPVTNLYGSYLGKIFKIHHKAKTAEVRDRFRYKETHSLSELLSIPKSK